MPMRRLDIELSWDEYELLQREAEARGTTVPALIHELIVSQRARLLERARNAHRDDPLLQRQGSFDGPPDLAERHDQYLYGSAP